jgi:hypothetical protein
MSDRLPPNQPERPRPPKISQRPPSERIPQAQQSGQFPPRQLGQDDATRAYKPPETRATKRPPSPPPSDPGSSALYVPWWGFVLVILAVAGITCGLWGLVLMNRGDSVAGIGPTPTPIFVVITATPTLGPAPGQATAPPTGPTQPSIPATLSTGPSATPAGTLPITVGSLVQVTGTDGVGVAVRQGPGLTYTYFFVGQDGDRFDVRDGPRDADGYTWWQVIDPNDPNRAGWMVENYLQVILPAP